MKRKLLILGVTGMLGHTLFTFFSKKSVQYEVYGTARNRGGLEKWFEPELLEHIVTNIDVNHYDTIVKAMGEIQPDIVINCVGITKQSDVAEDPLSVIPINALFPHRLAALCKVSGGRMIHFSTDCVFSGGQGNYTEDDIPDPVDLYGRSKLLGEVNTSGCFTLRTSIIGRELYTRYGLIEWFLSQKGKHVKGYARAIYTGFTTSVLADLICRIVDHYPELSGVWHVSSDPISKYELLKLVNQVFKLNITIEKDEAFVCDRSLNSSRFRKAIGYTPPTWQEMITQLVLEEKV
jgi:dTDP-4-dehydrorhamnose reductase